MSRIGDQAPKGRARVGDAARSAGSVHLARVQPTPRLDRRRATPTHSPDQIHWLAESNSPGSGSPDIAPASAAAAFHAQQRCAVLSRSDSGPARTGASLSAPPEYSPPRTGRVFASLGRWRVGVRAGMEPAPFVASGSGGGRWSTWSSWAEIRGMRFVAGLVDQGDCATGRASSASSTSGSHRGRSRSASARRASPIGLTHARLAQQPGCQRPSTR